MSRTIATSPPASHREALASVRPQMAKASVVPQPSATELATLAADAMRKGHGKLALAAAELELHEAHLGRLTKDLDLKLRHLLELGPAVLAAFGRGLVDTYGDLESPDAQAARDVAIARDVIDRLAQYVAFKRGVA